MFLCLFVLGPYFFSHSFTSLPPNVMPTLATMGQRDSIKHSSIIIWTRSCETIMCTFLNRIQIRVYVSIMYFFLFCKGTREHPICIEISGARTEFRTYSTTITGFYNNKAGHLISKLFQSYHWKWKQQHRF